MRVLVIGGSSAGGSLCETARRLDPTAEITLVSQEPWPMYSRCLLPRYINGEKTRGELAFRPSDWAERQRIRVILGKAASLSPTRRVVILESGQELGYDRLGLATGASATRPSIPGIESRGVFNLYTLASAEAIKAWLPETSKVMILGAGLIGMKAAAAFTWLNKQVVLVEQKRTVLPDTLDPRAAELMSRLFTNQGIQVLTDETICEVLAAEDGRILGARLASGGVVECDMLVCAVGTMPNKGLVEAAGGAIRQGVLVDEFMETSLPGVFAAGDVAEARMVNTGRILRTANWFNSKREGRLAAFNMLGERSPYVGRLRANAVELLGLAMVSVGEIESEDGEEQILDDPSGLRYKRLVLRNDRLVGFTLLGDVAQAGFLSGVVENFRNIRPIKDRMLEEGANSLPSLSFAGLFEKRQGGRAVVTSSLQL